MHWLDFDFTMPAEATKFLGEAVAYWPKILRSVLILLIGLILARVLTGIFIRPWKGRLTPQAQMVIRKSISYTATLLILILILSEFGFKLTTLLGAAGIAGIAIGFAAQTSLSNFISGIFLLWERPFQVGDVITIGDQTGVVESIDLLSLTMRTFANLSVRIPNETIVKSNVINVTRYPVRRFDIRLGVSYNEDVDRVLAVLHDVAQKNILVLEEPGPLIAFTGFGESQLDLFVGVWHERADFIELRTGLLRDIKQRFQDEGIEIPYPHRVVIGKEGPVSA